METSWPNKEARGPALDESAIVSFERRFNFRLPEDYRNFQQKCLFINPPVNKIVTPINGVLFMDVVPMTTFAISALRGYTFNSAELFGVSLTVTRRNFEAVTGEGLVQALVGSGCSLFIFVEYTPVEADTEGLVLTAAQKQALVIG